jgi:ATP-dependent helicase/nuclease subunit A
MSQRRAIPRDTLDRQRRASDPKRSAWVSAHAGSGKTHVLSQRVVRLLLAGVAPSRILCLTYTKAAAANMAARIFDILGEWVLLDDERLADAIAHSCARTPGPADLVFARRLFARTVETPGGLKIQTIHAFCERLLHLFPFEANVAAGFRVVDDIERLELLERARMFTLDEAVSNGGELDGALQNVARQTSSAGFDELIRELLEHRACLREMARCEAYVDNLRRSLEVDKRETLASLEREIIAGGIPYQEWRRLADALRQGGAKDGELAERLSRAAGLAPESSCVDEYLGAFFTKEGKPRGVGQQKIISNGLRQQSPELLARLEGERDRLVPLICRRKAVATFESSLALAKIGAAIFSAYERLKGSRGLLDFDDLIERTRILLNRSSVSWVLYKLDQKIDHILVDEAQDTSAPQWDILASLAAEFCAGAGARNVVRTFFAVGDEKQSIFSFQGAAPDKFDEMRRRFQSSFSHAERLFERVELTRSFRSVPEILSAVDAVFQFGDNRRGLCADLTEPAPRHHAWKADVPGVVEIWDLIGAQQSEPRADWRLPLDYANDSDPAVRLARKIAQKIRFLLASENGECVEDGGSVRAVEPGDVMILVRKRDAFFEAMIAALKMEGVAVAGADRLNLMDHIAVMDLVALGRAALLLDDDLTVATVLKSPFIGFDDDELMKLAPQREGSLFEALARSRDPSHVAAAREIERWSRDARELPPFDFYSLVLSAGGGRKKLVGRLGFEANDAIDEFLRLALAFEREQAPSLGSFLANVESLEISVKRDMETAVDAVRVMTVHAAKGLEAKIVFLPDTCGAPSGRHDPKIFALGDEEDGSALSWSTKMDLDPPAVMRAREKLRQSAADEHCRLLYVAMTRAEERLYIAGYHRIKGPANGCWYEMIREALAPSCETLPDPDDERQQILRRGPRSAMAALAKDSALESIVEIPAFARNAARKEHAPQPPLRPSSALASADVFASSADERLAPTRRDSERLLAGQLVHALLQHLPQTAPERRVDAARRFLALRGSSLAEPLRSQLVDSVIRVIEDRRLAPLFGPNSASEVDIVARVQTARGEIAINGRIDRLAELEQEALLADFKTGDPRADGAFAPSHLRQLALYRAAAAQLYAGKRVRCFLVWTQNATAIEASDESLDAAFAQVEEERFS